MGYGIGGSALERVAVIGNYQPRRCGIATFTTDIVGALAAYAPATDWAVVAMNDIPGGYAYPAPVRLTIEQDDLAAYGRTASLLNAADVDLVLVQHEYGIFGGAAGEHLLALLRGLRAPVITTLHTILREPDADQRRVLEAVARRSARVVTMSRLGAERLRTIYGVPAAKIATIPHGIPDVPLVDPAPYKAALGLAGRPTMLTFGLLSPGKGIETVIDALPAIAARYPDFAYLVVGETHPHIKQRAGESYRDSLLALVATLGVSHNLIFDDRFVELDELVRRMAAADLYITPYLGREQIVSGTLAYTVGAGKAVISTPYPYAEELLADGRGVLVPFGSSAAVADRVLRLLDYPEERQALSERAYRHGRCMIWSSVAAHYLRVFRDVAQEGANAQRPHLPTTLVVPSAAATVAF
jgi:glycosyltransferase involved in cell wall biosynthesis